MNKDTGEVLSEDAIKLMSVQNMSDLFHKDMKIMIENIEFRITNFKDGIIYLSTLKHVGDDIKMHDTVKILGLTMYVKRMSRSGRLTLFLGKGKNRTLIATKKE